LIHAQLEVALIELADRLTPPHAGAEVDGDLGEPPGDLGAEHDLLVGRESPGRRYRPRHRPLSGRRHSHLAWRLSRRLALWLLGADRGPTLTTAEQEAESDHDGGQRGDGHSADHTSQTFQKLRAVILLVKDALVV